jgi:hypothetical protein
MNLQNLIPALFTILLLVIGPIHIYFDFIASLKFNSFTGVEKKNIYFRLVGSRRLPFLLFTEEYREFLKNGSKEVIEMMKYYIRAYFFTLIPVLISILVLAIYLVFFQ